MSRKLRWGTLLVTAVAFTVYAALIALYVQLESDIALRDGLWCNLVYYAYHAVNIAAFFWVYAATIYTVYLDGWRKTLPLAGIYIGMVAYKYALNFVVGSITDGAFPSWDNFWRQDLRIIGPELLLEIGQYALVCVVIALSLRVWRGVREQKEDDLAFRSMFSLKNPLQRTALLVGAVMTLLRVVQHLFYQFVLLVYQAEFEGWLILTVDLVADVLIGFVGCLVMTLLIQSFIGWDGKMATKENDK